VGLRFFRRIGILPGVTLNLTKRGLSASFGPRGAKITVGTSGSRATVGLPGTGLFYTTKLKPSPRAVRRTSPPAASSVVPAPPGNAPEPVHMTAGPTEGQDGSPEGFSLQSKRILDELVMSLGPLDEVLGDPDFGAQAIKNPRQEMRDALLLVGIGTLMSDGGLTDGDVLLIYDLYEFLHERTNVVNDAVMANTKARTSLFKSGRDVYTKMYEKNKNKIPAAVSAILQKLNLHDRGNGNGHAVKARSMFVRFARALAECDAPLTAKETAALSDLEQLLNAGMGPLGAPSADPA
jgi:hypothetical protein